MCVLQRRLFFVIHVLGRRPHHGELTSLHIHLHRWVMTEAAPVRQGEQKPCPVWDSSLRLDPSMGVRSTADVALDPGDGT